MKVRDSGMPDEPQWVSYFNPADMFDRLGISQVQGDALDVGCGYGQFAIELARRSTGTVYAIDIEPAMIAATQQSAAAAKCNNLVAKQTDLFQSGLGVADHSLTLILLFNLLHAEHPDVLLQKVYSALQPGGLLAVTHWRGDVPTPRGPDLSIRPRPEDCVHWGVDAGFLVVQSPFILPPWHFGLLLQRPASLTTHESSP